MKVSIIVPVYQVEDYLERCLESLAQQTCNDLEIIIVNDGSKDHSQEIIDRYTSKYPFMKGYYKENGGLSDARNYGIEKATGEYLAFVDSDDYVDVEMYDALYQKAISKNFDLVVCDFQEEYETHVQRCSCLLDHDLFTKDDVKKCMCDFYPSAWNKLYKRTLFTTLRFKKNVWFEDVELCYRLLPSVNSIGVVPRAFYHYIQRTGSISNSNDVRIYHTIDNWNGIIQFYQEQGLYDEYYKELEYLYVRYLYATFMKSAVKFDFVHFKEAVVKAQREVKRNFPHYRKNNYFYHSLKGIYLLSFQRIYAYILYCLKHNR